MQSWIATALVAPVLVAAAPATPQEAPLGVRAEQLESIHDSCRIYLEEMLARDAFPGVSAALILPDGSEVTCAVGLASIEDERKLAVTDRFLSGSIGKTWFSAAALHLAELGKLELDAPVSGFFEEDDWYARIPNAEAITVRQLMRHQTGIPRYAFVRQFWEVVMAEPDKVWTPQERLAYIFDRPPLFAPGEGWAYSDTNYILLGAILEKVSGVEVYEYVETHLLTPHELRDTIPSDRRGLPGVVQGYARAMPGLGLPDRVIEDGQFVFNPQFEWCGGGFANTPADLARWARILYTGEAFEGEYLPKLLDTVSIPGSDRRYGLGVFVSETELGDLIGHDGFMPGYLSTMGWFPEHRIAAAFQANSDDGRKLGVPLQLVLRDLARIAQEELAKSD